MYLEEEGVKFVPKVDTATLDDSFHTHSRRTGKNVVQEIELHPWVSHTVSFNYKTVPFN